MTSKEFTALIIRLILGFIYLSAGLSKLAPEHLGNIIGPVDLSVLSDSWIIDLIMKGTAVVQIVGGALILTQRYSLLGLMFLLPLSIGVLILTIFAGFGGTVFINLFLFLIHLIALVTDTQFKQILKEQNLKYLLNSSTVQLFPGKIFPNIALGIFILIIPFCTVGGIYLNVLATLSLLFITINLFQFKKHLIIDYIILGLFFIIGFIILNGIILNSFIPKFFYLIFILIPLGAALYLTRLIIRYFQIRNN